MQSITIINEVCTVVVSIAGSIGIARKWPKLFRAVQYVEQHAGEIVESVEHVAEAIAETPTGAVIKQHLQSEMDKLTDKLRKSEISRLALIGLHSFGGAMDSLSDTQKIALSKFVADAVPAEWNVTPDEVERALNAMEKAANNFSQLEIVKAANVFTAAQKSAPVPNVTTTGSAASTVTVINNNA